MQLLLLPGLHGTSDLFGPFIRALPPSLDTLPLSYPEREHLTIPSLALFVSEYIPSNQPFVLLAESFSGAVALTLASKGAPYLRGILLCGSLVRHPHPVLARCCNPLLIRLTPDAFLLHRLAGAYVTDDLRSLCGDLMSRLSPAVLSARLKEILRFDALPLIAHCPVPVHYIRPSRDKVIPKGQVGLLEEHCPHVPVTVVPGPHLLLQTNPAAAAEVVLEFLSGLTGVRPA